MSSRARRARTVILLFKVTTVLGWCLILFGIVALCVVLAARPAGGAPVPPRPKELPAASLVGRWSLDWSGRPGTVWLFEDGGYTETLDDSPGIIYHGQWRLEGNVLVMEEWRYDAERHTQSGPMLFVVPLELKDYPRGVSGQLSRYSRVALRDLRR